MSNTPVLGMPEIAAAQAQKHVTHNEALKVLDAVVQLSVLSRSVNTPPVSPGVGDRYLITPVAFGDWDGHGNEVTVWDGSSWGFYAPQDGWLAWVQSEDQLVAWQGTFWGTPDIAAVASPSGAQMNFNVLEELVTLSGASVDTTIAIPNGAIVFNVSELVVTPVTGATSFSVGVAGNESQFGSGLFTGNGGNNVGAIGPTAFYADTPIRITSAGGNFTGGEVRIAIHHYLGTPPTS